MALSHLKLSETIISIKIFYQIVKVFNTPINSKYLLIFTNDKKTNEIHTKNLKENLKKPILEFYCAHKNLLKVDKKIFAKKPNGIIN